MRPKSRPEAARATAELPALRRDQPEPRQAIPYTTLGTPRPRLAHAGPEHDQAHQARELLVLPAEERMTPDTLKLLARYNDHVNRAMGGILAGLDAAEWDRPLGGFYPSIRALCSHLFVTDLAWLKRVSTLRSFPFSQNAMLARTPAWGEMLFPTVADYATDREALDGLLTQLAEELSAEDLAARLHYKDWRGVDQDRNVGGLLVHMFNHQTHHRGMISLYLEQLGKQNDFSSMVPLV